MTKKQIRRLQELRLTLDSCAKPLRDVDLLRQIVDELLAILLKQPGDTDPRAERPVRGKALGGIARAKAMTPERRSEVARKAANKRWHGDTHG